MQENEGLLKSLEVLGDKIRSLEIDVNYERHCKDQLAKDVERLSAENGELENQLGKVKDYIKTQTAGVE